MSMSGASAARSTRRKPIRSSILSAESDIVSAILQRVYTSAGRDGLIAAIERRLVDRGVAGDDYLLVDPSFVPLAGNLTEWPSALKDASGWGTFAARKGQALLRARYETLSDGSRL